MIKMLPFDAHDSKRVGWWETHLRDGRVSHPVIDAVNALEAGDSYSFSEELLAQGPIGSFNDMLLAAHTVFGWHGHEFSRNMLDRTYTIIRKSESHYAGRLLIY